MKPSVLIVEDDPSILNGLQMNLEMEGYAISIAKDGRSATDIFEEARPDLVILDIMLPKLNGFEVLERIRGSEGQPYRGTFVLDHDEDLYTDKVFDDAERILLRSLANAVRREQLVCLEA